MFSLAIGLAALLVVLHQTCAMDTGQPKDHKYYEELRASRGVMHQHLWQTLDGTRAVVEQMKDIPAEQYYHPQFNRSWGAVQDLMGEAPPPLPPDVPNSPVARCPLALGSWCHDWWGQEQVTWRPPPRGSKSCPGDCDGLGVCNHDTGFCSCPAGYGGDDCKTIIKRPCSHRFRNREDPLGVPVHNLGPDMHDKDWSLPGWTASRCGGYCDDTLGLCYCGFNSTFRHIPAPPGSPRGTPPIQKGRTLINPCQPSTDFQGRKTDWGHIALDRIYGPQGWCQHEVGTAGQDCGCALGSTSGRWCEQTILSYCPNQCNLRGTCIEGWCKCDKDWYGTSCDLKKAGLPIEPVPDERINNTYIKLAWRPSKAAEDPPPRTERRRPFIYIYDLPADYNSRILQLAFGKSCPWRGFGGMNESSTRDTGYTFETYFHDTLAASSHRTFDPEEADFFFAPVYLTCYLWPVHGWTDGPWYYAPEPNPRPMHASNMMLEVGNWLASHLPYWNRRQGRDHIFLALHDEGACYMPTSIYQNASFLLHWGRMDPEHTSGSGWPPDNYSHPIIFPGYQDKDWRLNYKGHPCYTPGKDLVIPAFKHYHHFHTSNLLGVPPVNRDILLSFKGDIGMWREWWYSRGIRQSLYRLAQEDGWRKKYNIVIGSRDNYPADYSMMLSRSVFCLVVPGDGYATRAEDAILHGCLPLVIMDNVHAVYETILDWSKFSIRVPQARMAELPQILQAVNQTTILQMQRELAKVQHRFAYTTGPLQRHGLSLRYRDTQHIRDSELPHLPKGHPFVPLSRFPLRNDAFHTIMQWLYGRIKETR